MCFSVGLYHFVGHCKARILVAVNFMIHVAVVRPVGAAQACQHSNQ